MNKTHFSRFLLTMVSILVFWGCYPDGAEYYEDTDITYTQHDVNFDFGARQTYALPDRIVIDVEIEEGDTSFIYMKDVYATPILQTIDANMSSYGWTKVAISANPDLLVTPAAMKSTTFFTAIGTTGGGEDGIRDGDGIIRPIIRSPASPRALSSLLWQILRSTILSTRPRSHG
jgi:hypothetical protein